MQVLIWEIRYHPQINSPSNRELWTTTSVNKNEESGSHVELKLNGMIEYPTKRVKAIFKQIGPKYTILIQRIE